MEVYEIGDGQTDLKLGVLVMLAVELLVAGVGDELEMGYDDA
jgi:hypothetical protein